MLTSGPPRELYKLLYKLKAQPLETQLRNDIAVFAKASGASRSRSLRGVDYRMSFNLAQ